MWKSVTPSDERKALATGGHVPFRRGYVEASGESANFDFVLNSGKLKWRLDFSFTSM